MVARLPASRTRAEDELRLQITLGNALITAKGYAAPETAAVYARARQLCDQLGDGPHFLPVLYGLWNNVFVSGQHRAPTSSPHRSSSSPDASTTTQSWSPDARVGWTLVFNGRASEAQQHLDLIPSTIDPPHTAVFLANYTEDPAAAGLAALSWARWLTGDDTAAQQASRQSLQRAASINHPFTQAYVHVMAAILAQLGGDPVAAEHHATIGIEISQQHAIPFFEAVAMTPLGWARARSGDPHGGVDIVRDGLAAAAATGAGVHRSLALATLGELLIAVGDIDAALTTLDDAMTTANVSAKPSTPRRSNDCAATRTVRQATTPRRWRPPNSHSNACRRPRGRPVRSSGHQSAGDNEEREPISHPTGFESSGIGSAVRRASAPPAPRLSRRRRQQLRCKRSTESDALPSIC